MTTDDPLIVTIADAIEDADTLTGDIMPAAHAVAATIRPVLAARLRAHGEDIARKVAAAVPELPGYELAQDHPYVLAVQMCARIIEEAE